MIAAALESRSPWARDTEPYWESDEDGGLCGLRCVAGRVLTLMALLLGIIGVIAVTAHPRPPVAPPAAVHHVHRDARVKEYVPSRDCCATGVYET